MALTKKGEQKNC